MSGTFDNITKCGSFNIAEKKALVAQFRATGITGEQAAITALTDNTGGTANNTLVAIPATTPADLAAQGVINGNIRDNLADLAAKVNAILSTLTAAGVTA